MRRFDGYGPKSIPSFRWHPDDNANDWGSRNPPMLIPEHGEPVVGKRFTPKTVRNQAHSVAYLPKAAPPFQVTCWCEREIVLVPVVGSTISCGRDDCRPGGARPSA